MQLRHSLRQREVEAVFRHVPADAFDDALELGAGDGVQSRMLARYARKVLCTDLNADRLIGESHPRITYDICDAEELPYESGRFDLIYSSNLLEHVPTPERALSEMHRVLRDDGVMVHIIPNRFWKVLHLALFYPSQALRLLEILLSRRRSDTDDHFQLRGNNLKGQRASFIGRIFWPAVHGEFPNHRVEFARLGAAHWTRMFSTAGFQVVGYVDGLPVHSPYRFGMEGPRRLLEARGFSSSHGYVLMKADRARSHAQGLRLGVRAL